MESTFPPISYFKLKGIGFEIDKSVQKSQPSAKEKDILNVLTNNRRNKDRAPNREEEKMDGLSMVDGFQVVGYKVDGKKSHVASMRPKWSLRNFKRKCLVPYN